MGNKSDASYSIDENFSLQLFHLWMTGKTPNDLINMFRGTEREFSKSSLFRTMNRFGWREKREAILATVRKKNEAAIDYVKSEQIKTMNQIAILAFQNFEIEMKNFLINPDQIPSWLPTNIKELETLFKTYQFVISENVDKSEAEEALGDDISDEAAAKILKILADESTKKLFAQMKQN